MIVSNFQVRPEQGYYYTLPVDSAERVEQAELDFRDMLEDFPEPHFLWLDQRGDDCLNGPGCWECEIQNDHETRFTFNTSLAEPEIIIMLAEALLDVLADQTRFDLDPDAIFKLNYVYWLEYSTGSMINVYHVHLDVFWEAHT